MSPWRKVLLLALLVSSLAAGLRSLQWPLQGDPALMHYVSWMIEGGAVPYRDVFDMNLPGTYAVHWIARACFGTSDLAWRLFDLSLLSLACLSIFAFCRPFGRTSSIIAALSFASFHLGAGPGMAGQRDFVMAVFLLASALSLVAAVRRRGHLGLVFLSGLAIGAAASIKPSALAYAPAWALAFWSVGKGYVAALDDETPIAMESERPEGPFRSVLAFATGVFALPALFWMGLAHLGGWHDFVVIFTQYTLPLYRDLLAPSPRKVWILVAILTAFGITCGWSLLDFRRQHKIHGIRLILLLGMSCGLLHFLVQGKGWIYHAYPFLVFFLAALGTFGMEANSHRPAYRLRRLLWTSIALVACSILVTKGWGRDPQSQMLQNRVENIEGFFESRLQPGDSIQPLDTSSGAVRALLRMGVRLPTRFLYDFPLYHDVEHPYIRSLRHEFMSEMQSTDPAWLIMTNVVFPSREGFERLDRFPELRDRIESHYRLALESEGVRIYQNLRLVTPRDGRTITAAVQ